MVFLDPPETRVMARDFIRWNCHFSVCLPRIRNESVTAAHGILWSEPEDVSLNVLLFRRCCCSCCYGGFDTEIIVFSGGRFVFLGDHVLVLRNRSRPRRRRQTQPDEAIEKRIGDGNRKRGSRWRTHQREEPIPRSFVQIRSQINSGSLSDRLRFLSYLEPEKETTFCSSRAWIGPLFADHDHMLRFIGALMIKQWFKSMFQTYVRSQFQVFAFSVMILIDHLIAREDQNSEGFLHKPVDSCLRMFMV